MDPTEAEFEREAVRMLRNIGLKNVQELHYFQTPGSKRWKEGLRKPSEPRIRRFRTDDTNPKTDGVGQCPSPTTEFSFRSKGPLSSSTTNSTYSYRSHERLTHTKSAPEVKCLQSEPNPKFKSSNIPVPVSRTVTMAKPGAQTHKKLPDTKVLYSRKPSLKILSVATDTGVHLPTSVPVPAVTHHDEDDSLVTPKHLNPVSVYDRLAEYQDLAPEPLDKETEDSALKSTMMHPNAANESLQSEANPDPAMVSMSAIVSNTMQALSTLMDVVAPSNNDFKGEDPQSCTEVSNPKYPSNNERDKQPGRLQENDFGENKSNHFASEQPSTPSNTDVVLQAKENIIGLDDQDDFFGYCHQCDEAVVGEETGCLALGKVYHTACLTCSSCKKQLHGKVFYTLDQSILCEIHYVKNLQRCHFCNQRIKEKVLTAFEEVYHPDCFRCAVCGVCLDGVPYAGQRDKVYCIKDYHKLFAPLCSSCGEPIVPQPGKRKNVRVLVKDRYYHVRCYKCEDCGVLFAGSRKQSFFIDGHLYCPKCRTTHVSCVRTTIL